MSFKHDFMAALRAGDDHHALMELVGRHRAHGLSVDLAYEALQELWLEHSFDKHEGEQGLLQNRLESVMEKVWYGQPVL